LQIDETGIAARIALDFTSDIDESPLGLYFNASFALEFNSTGRAIDTIGGMEVNLRAGEYGRVVIEGMAHLRIEGTELFGMNGVFLIEANGDGLLLYAAADIFFGATEAENALLRFEADSVLAIQEGGIAA